MGKSRPSDPQDGSKEKPGTVCTACAANAKAAADPCGGKGFADPAYLGDFTKDFKTDVMKDWDTMTPDQRFAAVKKLQEKQFAGLDIPKPTIDRSTDTAAGFDDPVTQYGTAHASDWGMTYNGNLFSQAPLSEHDQKELAKTMMHEGRHLEQYYKTAQLRAGDGDSADDIRTKDTATHKPIDVPRSVVDEAVKSPLPKDKADKSGPCPNQAFAQTMNDAKWGKGDLSQYRAGVDYADRPLEKDAFALEPTIDAKW